jgi:uncharacterized Tic20 family protein
MTEPPRPPGEGNPNDPTAPFNPYAANDPSSGSAPPPPPPDGYAPPPAGGYPPPPGGAPQYGYGPQPGAQQDDKTWILLAHFGGAGGAFLGGACAGWIVPLIAMLARGQQSPIVRAEAVKALNFQILWTIVAVVGYVLMCIGIGLLVVGAAWLIAVIFGVIAGIKANNNEPYNYPMSVQFIK